MAILSNPRHEKFSQLVASGIKPTEAYISLGYSAKGAPQSANKLLKRTDVREKVNEILQAAAVSTAAEIAFDQQRVLNRLDILSRKAEDLGQISAAVRCEELIGKYRGMFIDRQVADVAISSEPSIVEILRARRAKREQQGKTDADSPTLLT
jgi:Terminase small subunit